jgi:hypothetical protein
MLRWSPFGYQAPATWAVAALRRFHALIKVMWNARAARSASLK